MRLLSCLFGCAYAAAILLAQSTPQASRAAAPPVVRMIKFQNAKPLTDDDVISMVRAGLGDELTVAKIKQAPSVDLDVSAEALVRMKKAGASEAVIDAVMKRSANAAAK